MLPRNLTYDLDTAGGGQLASHFLEAHNLNRPNTSGLASTLPFNESAKLSTRPPRHQLNPMHAVLQRLPVENLPSGLPRRGAESWV